MPRPKYTYCPELESRGYVRNRSTLKRRIDSGTFPPPVDIGPNTVAWVDVDLDEVDRRGMDGVTSPNKGWPERTQQRKARAAARQSAAA